jgi:hypothetical protein
MPHRLPCLGVDWGNVIIDHMGFGTTDEFVLTRDYNTIWAMPGVMESLAWLSRERFENRIFVAYNATNVVDQKVFAWLDRHRFHQLTGIPPSRVHRSWDGRDKSDLCRKYGATHFVDDRLEVLGMIQKVVPHLYLFRHQPQEVAKFEKDIPLTRVNQINSWPELAQKILSS